MANDMPYGGIGNWIPVTGTTSGTFAVPRKGFYHKVSWAVPQTVELYYERDQWRVVQGTASLEPTEPETNELGEVCP